MSENFQKLLSEVITNFVQDNSINNQNKQTVSLKQSQQINSKHDLAYSSQITKISTQQQITQNENDNQIQQSFQNNLTHNSKLMVKSIHDEDSHQLQKDIKQLSEPDNQNLLSTQLKKYEENHQLQKGSTSSEKDKNINNSIQQNQKNLEFQSLNQQQKSHQERENLQYSIRKRKRKKKKIKQHLETQLHQQQQQLSEISSIISYSLSQSLIPQRKRNENIEKNQISQKDNNKSSAKYENNQSSSIVQISYGYPFQSYVYRSIHNQLDIQNISAFLDIVPNKDQLNEVKNSLKDDFPVLYQEMEQTIGQNIQHNLTRNVGLNLTDEEVSMLQQVSLHLSMIDQRALNLTKFHQPTSGQNFDLFYDSHNLSWININNQPLVYNFFQKEDCEEINQQLDGFLFTPQTIQPAQNQTTVQTINYRQNSSINQSQIRGAEWKQYSMTIKFQQKLQSSPNKSLMFTNVLPQSLYQNENNEYENSKILNQAVQQQLSPDVFQQLDIRQFQPILPPQNDYQNHVNLIDNHYNDVNEMNKRENNSFSFQTNPFVSLGQIKIDEIDSQQFSVNNSFSFSSMSSMSRGSSRFFSHYNSFNYFLSNTQSTCPSTNMSNPELNSDLTNVIFILSNVQPLAQQILEQQQEEQLYQNQNLDNQPDDNQEYTNQILSNKDPPDQRPTRQRK